jgi:hypothetical protein
VGFFREFYPDHSSLPWLRDHTGTRRIRSESEIVEYLRAGHMIAGIMEWSTDVLDGTSFEDGSGAPSLLTDGTWLWRRDLADYVERYHVELPDDFVLALVESGFRMPDLSAHDLAALTAAEEEGLGSDWWGKPRPTARLSGGTRTSSTAPRPHQGCRPPCPGPRPPAAPRH